MHAAPDPDRLHRLILEEWPAVPPDAVRRAGPDLDQLTAVVAEHTDHTRALVRLQIAELVLVAERLAQMQGGGGAPPGATEGPSPSPPPSAAREGVRPKPPLDDPDLLLGQVEAYLWELARAVPNDLATASARGARRHLGTSLSIAAAVGFLLGLFVGGGVRRTAGSLGADASD